MFIRHAATALLISLVGASSAWAQPAPKLTYFDQVIDMTELLPPPPPLDTPAGREDLTGVIEAQENRTDAKLRRATAQKTLTIYLYAEVLGPKFKKENLPVMDAFFERMQGDARAVLVTAKNAIQRLRPIASSKEVIPLAGVPRLPTGYPSGGTVFTTSTAILLGKMIPEKRYDLFESNRDFGNNRIMIGEHFPRDIRAGEIAATVITRLLMEKPAFMRDFEAARAELRQALDYPPEPELVGTVKPQ